MDAGTDFGTQADVPGEPGLLLNKEGSGVSVGTGVIVTTPVPTETPEPSLFRSRPGPNPLGDGHQELLIRLSLQSGRGLEVLVTNWPQDYSAGWTLAAETSRSGVGLHTGAEATVELRPTDQPGFHMRLPGMEQPIQLRPDQVRDSQLCTTLDLGSSKVATVEHLLAALAGCGLSHVEIGLNGHEVPLLDLSLIHI